MTRAEKTWNVFTALGNVAFAYSFSMILIEIEVYIISDTYYHLAVTVECHKLKFDGKIFYFLRSSMLLNVAQ